MSMMPDDNPIAYLTLPGNGIHTKLKVVLDKLKDSHPEWFEKQSYQTTLWEDHFPMTQEATDFIASCVATVLDLGVHGSTVFDLGPG